MLTSISGGGDPAAAMKISSTVPARGRTKRRSEIVQAASESNPDRREREREEIGRNFIKMAVGAVGMGMLRERETERSGERLCLITRVNL